MMEFGCCSSFKDCSDVGFCVSRIKESRDNCLYEKRLKQGFNFYSETYKENKLYITLGGRQFYIGIRSSYGGFTYALDENAKSKLKPYFDQLHIGYSDKVIFSQCQVEDTSEDNRAYCIVVITIDSTKYNIHNFNIRALTKETAASIKNFLNDKGIPAFIESVGRASSGSAKEKRKEQIKAKPMSEESRSKDQKNKSSLTGQISMFDLQEVQLQAFN